jgi:spore germination cell wall hydrolase CwlJ-like protein
MRTTQNIYKFNTRLILLGISIGIFLSLIAATAAYPHYKNNTIIQTNTKIIEVPVIKKVIIKVPVNLTHHDKKQINCLAENAYHEARGEPRRGIIAVNNVVLNRTKQANKFGKTACEVIYKKANDNCAFSWVCDDTLDNKKNPAVYQAVYKISENVYLENVSDVTGGATYFHAATITRKVWPHVKKTKRIGNHVFFREA